MPDSNPRTLPQKSGAQPMSPHICYLATCDWLSCSNESSMSHPVIVHRTMLSSICFHPKVHVIVQGAILSSRGLCYRPKGYVIIHRAMLSTRGLRCRPQSYVIVQGAILSSTGLCYHPQGCGYTVY